MDNTAQPNIFVPTGGTSTPQLPQPPISAGRKWITPKNIFIVLGIIVVIELIFGLRSVIKPSSTASPDGGILNLPATRESNKGAIFLTSDKKEVKVGDTIAVSVGVNSPKFTAGVDVVAKFDPAMLSAIDGDIHQGTIFSKFPLSKVDPSGFLSISGIATPGTSGFSGKDIFAIVNFKTLKKGVAKITLDFTPGSTADSNIVGTESGKDLLEEVGNLEIVIK
ncbi:MAG: Uncharacterized protein G01um10147_710 [Microgenomates group bacterium Gr01-1014_7]|nr:MAG: Uncharacterized protein G01um10147_710 [Microgenomates group bacterium Gr01-1014_7]